MMYAIDQKTSYILSHLSKYIITLSQRIFIKLILNIKDETCHFKFHLMLIVGDENRLFKIESYYLYGNEIQKTRKYTEKCVYN